MSRFLDSYRKDWARVGGVAAMALGGATLLANRKNVTNLRALAVMNSMSMSAHQFEEYVEPGWLAGAINVGVVKSDNPRGYPFNTNSAMCANWAFSALYVPAMLFPNVKWLVLPPVLLGFAQTFAHGVVMPIRLRKAYTPGALTAALIQVPIGIAYLDALRRSEGPLAPSDWLKSAGVLAAFAVGVAAPHIALADKNSPYAFTDRQLGPYASAALATTDTGAVAGAGA